VGEAVRVEALVGGASDPETGMPAEMLDADKILHYWPNIIKMLDEVPHTWEKNFTKEFFLQAALHEKMQIWAIGDGSIRLIIFTQIAVFPVARILEVIWAAGIGVLDTAGPVVDGALEHFAVSQECSRIDIHGRGGWERILAPWGFKRTSVILSRPVDLNRRAH